MTDSIGCHASKSTRVWYLDLDSWLDIIYIYIIGTMIDSIVAMRHASKSLLSMMNHKSQDTL